MTEANSKSQEGECWVAGGENKIIIIILNGYV